MPVWFDEAENTLNPVRHIDNTGLLRPAVCFDAPGGEGSDALGYYELHLRAIRRVPGRFLSSCAGPKRLRCEISRCNTHCELSRLENLTRHGLICSLEG